jgi:CHAT domain-containing protein
LTSYDGKSVRDAAALRAAVEAAGPGRAEIVLGFWRDGDLHETRAVPGLLGVGVAAEPPDVAGPRLLAGDQVGVALRSAAERGSRLRPLPGSRKEVEAIAGAVAAKVGESGRVTVLVGKAARESALFDAARGARYLHLATHGLVDETEMASFSALALTMPTVPAVGDDGFLTLVDLFGRWQGRLDGTDLVVLSACDSARGREQRHEGAYALPWGFLFAGARAVVASQWKVDDEATAFLMADMYRRMFAGDGQAPIEALRGARLATKALYPHPYHWGAFVFAGAPR